jgi:serine O-acetyltransferase
LQLCYLKHDLYRYFYPNNNVLKISFYHRIILILFTQSIWAIIVYRLRRWVLTECRNRILVKILNIIGCLIQLFIEIVSGIHILPSAEIGPGLYIGHFGNIFIGHESQIGKFCNLSQENTIGVAGRGETRGEPIIGDFVYIGPGAKIFGKILVGNHVAIGANAVVNKDIPDSAVVVGVPAKLISYKASKDFIEYNCIVHKEILE